MASINWPSALSDVLVSNATVSEPGLAGWWSMNTVSEYPTGSSPTYFQDAWATVDGWTSGGTVSVSGGVMRFTKTAASQSVLKTIAIPSGSTVRIRARYVAGSGTPSSFDLTVGVTGATSAPTTVSLPSDGAWAVANVTTTGIGSNIFFYLGSLGGVATYAIEFDWIYIGDGSYAANSLLDNSGNGSHGQILGATPVDGVSGKALSFDFNNDYILFDKTKMAFTGAFSYQVAVQGKARTVLQYIMSRTYASGNRGWHLAIDANNRPTFVVSGDGTANVTLTADAGSEITSDCVLGCIFVPSSGMYITKNGVIVKSLTAGVPSSVFYSTLQVAVMGMAYGLTLNPFDGWLDEPRIYNRALSAAEVLYLYQNPSPYAALPNAPLQDGYSETKQNGVIRSSVDAGVPKMRQRFTAVTRQYNVSFALTSNMTQILDYFYYTTTSQGVALFNWTDPRTGASVEARFIEPPVHRPNGPEYVTSCTFEVLP